MDRLSVKKILYHTLRNDGGTFAHNGNAVDIDCGFIVGGAMASLVVPVHEIPARSAEISAYVDSVPQSCFIGTWLHHGAIYFDASDHIDDFWAAMKVAVDRHQIAF